jgi:hypothetical protein
MCRIENDAITCVAHPVVCRRQDCYTNVVPRSVKQNCALPKAMVSRQCFAHPRRENWPFYVDRTTRSGSGTQQIRLPAERRDLQHVDLLPDNRFSRGVDIGCHRNLQFAPDVRENIATFAHAGSAKRADQVQFALS